MILRVSNLRKILFSQNASVDLFHNMKWSLFSYVAVCSCTDVFEFKRHTWSSYTSRVLQQLCNNIWQIRWR